MQGKGIVIMNQKKINKTCTCEICGKEFATINYLHLRTHDLSVAQYKKQYPNAQLCSQEIIDKRTKKLKGRKIAWKDKISKGVKKSWDENKFQGRTGYPLSKKSKKALSKKLIGHNVSDETRQKIGESGKGREPWNKGKTKNNDSRLKSISQKITEYNKNMTNEERDKTNHKISQALKKRYINGMPIPHAKGHKRDDLDMYFRSSWEANYARYLKFKNKDIIYEKTQFPFYNKNGDIICVYTPDFKINEEHYIEIKGHADSCEKWTCSCKRCIRDKNKSKLMSEQYPNIRVEMIATKEYKKMHEKYKNVIQNWESPYDRRTTTIDKKVNEMISIRVSLFLAPKAYFTDGIMTSSEIKRILSIGDEIKKIMKSAHLAVDILTKDGWECEFCHDEIVFYNEKINTQEDAVEYLSSMELTIDSIAKDDGWCHIFIK